MNQSGGRWFSMKKNLQGDSTKRVKEAPVVASVDESKPFTMAALLRKKK
jgi:hypothetical protein